MFDKLIVSEPAGADIKNRRNYFMVSSLVVGVLFLTAVVFSIFAADYGLGNGSFDLVEMVMPPEMAAAIEPEPQPQNNQTQASNDQLSRVVNMSRVDEFAIIPTGTSSTPNRYLSRPWGDFKLGPTDSIGPGIVGRDSSGTGTPSTGLSSGEQVVADTPDIEPPPVRKDPPARKPSVSGGVVNGKATSLPKPIYSAAARAVRAQGKVQVQVTIDESGKVIFAKAVDGHGLLRSSAEDAAWKARFGITTLTGVAVKVTGVIVYNFTL